MMETERPSGMSGADSAAQGFSDRPADALVAPCAADEPLVSIAVLTLGETGKPVADVAFALRKDDAHFLYGKTDQQGEVRFDRLRKGSYELSPYLLDRDAWALDSSAALPGTAELGAEEASWQAAPTVSTAAFVHTVEAGECTAKLAERFGLFPETIWTLPANAELKALRKDRNILAPGDRLTIPAPRPDWVKAQTSRRYVFKRKAVPDVVRIRFLSDGEPRAKVPFIASMRYPDGQVLPDVAGETDADGFVALEAMPSVRQVEIYLSDGPEEERHVFAIGHVNPLDLQEGARERLSNLGYYLDDGEQDAADALRDALMWFQEDNLLPVSGKYDADTQARLCELHMS